MWNANFLKTDVYNKFQNRRGGNTKIVQWKTFIPTNNYDPSSNMINQNLYRFWSGLPYSNFCKKNKYKIMERLLSYPPEFQIFRKNIFHFMKQAKMCCLNRSRGVYPVNQGHIT